MKLLLISENRDEKTYLSAGLGTMGICLIHYLNPVKAMDNLEEIEPDLIVFNAGDYPRHWKPLHILLRDQFSREDCPLILLYPQHPDLPEAAKAAHLGVSAMLIHNDNDSAFLENLIVSISRLKSLDNLDSKRPYAPKEYDQLSFILTHPQHFNLVPGKILTLSDRGIDFLPDEPAMTADLEEDTPIGLCSLKIGDTSYSPTCRVKRNMRSLSLAFTDPPPEMLRSLREYIKSSPERSLAAHT